MKKLLMLAAAAAAILPMTAQAQSAPAAGDAAGNVTLNATAANTCAIRGLTSGMGTGDTVPEFISEFGEATGAATVIFKGNELINPVTAMTKGHQEKVVLSGFCNYQHSVKLESQNGGLIAIANANVVPQGNFNRRINYTAKITGWGPGEIAALATGNDAANGTSIPSSGAKTTGRAPTNALQGRIDMTFVENTTAPLLAGIYSDVLTVHLGTDF
jgi:hypothetical protein